MPKMRKWIAFFLIFLLIASLFCFAAFADGDATEGEQPEQAPAPTTGNKIAFVVIGVCIFGGIAFFLRWRFSRRAKYTNYSRYY